MSADAVRVVEQIQEVLVTGDVVAALADAEADERVREAFQGLAEPDFEVVMVGPSYLSARLEASGIDGFRGAWADWTSAFESYRIDVERVIDAGDVVVSLVAMSGRTRTGGVELEVGRAALARPRLGGVEEALSDPPRAAGGIDGEVLDPGPVAEANRMQVLVSGEEADQPSVLLGDEDDRVVGVDRLAQRDGGAALVPASRAPAGRREQPLIEGDHVLDLLRPRRPDLDLHPREVSLRRR